jgi:hypothetical protein
MHSSTRDNRGVVSRSKRFNGAARSFPTSGSLATAPFSGVSHACDTPRSWFGGDDRTASDRSTAVVHGSPGTPRFGPERSVSGPNLRESPGTRSDRKAKVVPSSGRFPLQTSRICSLRRIASHARGRWFEPSRAHSYSRPMPPANSRRRGPAAAPADISAPTGKAARAPRPPPPSAPAERGPPRRAPRSRRRACRTAG